MDPLHDPWLRDFKKSARIIAKNILFPLILAVLVSRLTYQVVSVILVVAIGLAKGILNFQLLDESVVSMASLKILDYSLVPFKMLDDSTVASASFIVALMIGIYIFVGNVSLYWKRFPRK